MKKSHKKRKELTDQELRKLSGGTAHFAGAVFAHSHKRAEPKAHEIQEKKRTAHLPKKFKQEPLDKKKP